jgi:hypothetical protein
MKLHINFIPLQVTATFALFNYLTFHNNMTVQTSEVWNDNKCKVKKLCVETEVQKIWQLMDHCLYSQRKDSAKFEVMCDSYKILLVEYLHRN